MKKRLGLNQSVAVIEYETLSQFAQITEYDMYNYSDLKPIQFSCRELPKIHILLLLTCNLHYFIQLPFVSFVNEKQNITCELHIICHIRRTYSDIDLV